MKHMNRTALLSFAFAAAVSLNAQAVLEPVARTMQCEKAEVLFLTVAPKGDRILVGTTKGADVMDLVSGKRVFHLDFMEDNSPAVYYALFNDNGEYVMLAGFTGKREIWDMKKGTKEGGNLSNFDWMPNSLAMKKLNLKIGNSPFDRFYQQAELKDGDRLFRAVKDGVVEVTDAEGKVVQRLQFPENKDQHHRAPLLRWQDWLLVGADDGRVLFFRMP